MANLLCASFLREKFSFPWSILSFFRSGLPKPHCVRFWQPSRSQKRKNWSRKRKSFSQKRNCACELCHFSATLFQLLRRFIPKIVGFRGTPGICSNGAPAKVHCKAPNFEYFLFYTPLYSQCLISCMLCIYLFAIFYRYLLLLAQFHVIL